MRSPVPFDMACRRGHLLNQPVCAAQPFVESPLSFVKVRSFFGLKVSRKMLVSQWRTLAILATVQSQLPLPIKAMLKNMTNHPVAFCLQWYTL